MSDQPKKTHSASKSGKKRSTEDVDADAKKAAKKSISDTFRHTMIQDMECKNVTSASFRDLEETDRRLMRAAGNWILKAQELMRTTGAETLTERVLHEIVEQGDGVPPLIVDILCRLMKGDIDERVILVQAFIRHHGQELSIKNADGSALIFGDAIAFVQTFIETLAEHGASADVFQQGMDQRMRVKGIETFDLQNEIAVTTTDIDKMRRELAEAETRVAQMNAKLQTQEAEMDKIRAVDVANVTRLAEGVAHNAAKCEAFIEAIRGTTAAKDLESVGFIECVSKMLPPINT